MAVEWVDVKCSDDVGTLARVTREAYETLYSSIGWRIVDDADGEASAPVASSPDRKTKPEKLGS